MKKYNCKNCKKEFWDYISNNRVFCGKKCKHIYQMRVKGKLNPQWSRVEKKCLECGNKFIVKNYRRNIAKFCSDSCCRSYRNEGKTPWYKVVRKSKKYKQWRTEVFERDNYTCIECGEKGGYLHADHIKPFALYPESRFELSNGRTLCVDCHKATQTYGRVSIFRNVASVEEA